MHEATIPVANLELVMAVFGPCDQNIRALREKLGVSITHRDGRIHVVGAEDAVRQATDVLEDLKVQAERREVVGSAEVKRSLSRANGDQTKIPFTTIDVVSASRTVKPRTNGQALYVEAINKHEVVLAIGPAGTGKTYLAVATAVHALKHHAVRKIVLVRPAVEAGESLGYLPGDLQAKINPYLRPLLDALQEMIPFDQIKKYMEMDVIEVVPLAYMRGRTLNDAFVILDEAQNTTIAQMKMFLTRMGEGSKLVVVGDTTQIDLPSHVASGLIDAVERLQDIKGIKLVSLTKSDIVRHRLVQAIVQAYEDPQNQSSGKKGRR